MRKQNHNLSILATGADIKSRFCISKDGKVSVSREFGNLEYLDNLRRFKNDLLRKKINPDIVAYDLHPAYFSSQLAMSLNVQRKFAVQHHHSHIASLMLAKNIKHKVIGVAFDGTGYGTDGNLWGGEFLVVDSRGFRRAGHLDYIRLPGGEAAIKEPWRIAFSILYDCFDKRILKENLELLRIATKQNYQILIKMLENNINITLSSSAGRLFDAVSSILGICQKVSFEAQAAIELEQCASKSSDRELYNFDIIKEASTYKIGYKNLLECLLSDLAKGKKKEVIARRFHNSLAHLIGITIEKIYKEEEVKDVILSGGVFQNKLLYYLTKQKIKDMGFNLLGDEQVPVNDLSICLGQLYVAQNSK